MKDLPDQASWNLGAMQLKTRFADEAECQRQIAADEAMQKEFLKDPNFMGLTEQLHGQLHHGPISASCEWQKALLRATVIKFFYAGWIAGRQEVMDAEVERLGKAQP